MTRTQTHLLALVLSGLFTATAYAAETESAKSLHNANCRSCHTSIMSGDPDSIYVREHRQVNSYPALQNQVNRCEMNTGIRWPQNKIDSVVDYLNQQFYKFKQ